MNRRVMIALKVGAHLLCLAPLIWLVHFCTSARVFLNADPVKFIIHFTGDWAIYLLLLSLALSLLGRLPMQASRLVRFHRPTALYAFFYATLHLLMYFFIYSGYDFIVASASFHTGHPGVLLVEWNAIFPALFDDFRRRPFLYLGLFTWALLLVSFVSSQGFVQHVLHGKKWEHLYRLVYIPAIAAVIHAWCFLISSVPTTGGRCAEPPRTHAISNLRRRTRVPRFELGSIHRSLDEQHSPREPERKPSS